MASFPGTIPEKIGRRAAGQSQLGRFDSIRRLLPAGKMVMSVTFKIQLSPPLGFGVQGWLAGSAEVDIPMNRLQENGGDGGGQTPTNLDGRLHER